MENQTEKKYNRIYRTGIRSCPVIIIEMREPSLPAVEAALRRKKLKSQFRDVVVYKDQKV